MKTDDLNVLCCFCGQGLQFKDAVEISFRLVHDPEEVQTIYAHPSCFDKVLYPGVPRLFETPDT